MTTITIDTRINGQAHTLAVDPAQTVAELLRNELGLHGTQEACGVGVCGSCTVLLDGKPVSSCLLLATNLEARELITIEGLSDGEKLDPVQEAFLEHHAFQCGFCTPGMILAVKGLLNEDPVPDPDGAREYLAGNICRCGTYAEVYRAVETLIPDR